MKLPFIYHEGDKGKEGKGIVMRLIVEADDSEVDALLAAIQSIRNVKVSNEPPYLSLLLVLCAKITSIHTSLSCGYHFFFKNIIF